MKMTTVALLMEKKQVSKVQDFLSLSNRSLQKKSSDSGYENGEGSKAVKRLRRFCFSYLMQFYLPLSRDIDKDEQFLFR